MAEAPDAATGAAPRRVSLRTIALLVTVAAVVYAIDQVSKHLVVAHLRPGEAVRVLGDLVRFRFVENSGAAFSLGVGMTWIFTIIAVGVAVVIVLFARRIRSIGWAVVFGLLLGGTLGNLTDRLLRPPGFGVGHVVDFVQLWGFPAIFNAADSAIVCAMAVFVVLTLRGVALDGRRVARRREEPPGGPSDGSGADEASAPATGEPR